MPDTPHTPESVLAEFTEVKSSFDAFGIEYAPKTVVDTTNLARYAALWRNEAADSEAIAVRLQQENEALRKECAALREDRDAAQRRHSALYDDVLRCIDAQWQAGKGREWGAYIGNILAEYVDEIRAERDALKAQERA